MATGLPAEILADEEVPVAMQQEAGHTARGQIAQGGEHCGALTADIVIPHPTLEQIAQDVERANAGCSCGGRDVRAQELDELPLCVRGHGIEMDVGDEEIPRGR